MTCEELTEFLSRYLDDELGKAEKSVFEAHLNGCPPCVVYLESLRETQRLGREACGPEESESCPEPLVKAILAAREAAKRDGT